MHFQILKIPELHRLTTHDNEQIRKLTVLSECVLWKNIIPGYSLKLTTEEEMQQQVNLFFFFAKRSFIRFISVIIFCDLIDYYLLLLLYYHY